jgi:ubiquinone/menaquinone biosynthesis C-methylase UbiE/DNA-binding transcriptional ArsR family regulator
MDPAYLKYVEYFRKHPALQQYYFWVGQEKALSAKDLSKKMGMAIQTVTNALKDLEKIGLLQSEKKGRVRTYTLKDPRLFKGLSSHSYGYYRGRQRKDDIISTSVFSQNMEKWLRYLADIMEGKLYVNQTFYTNILNSLKVDFVIENQSGQKLIMILNLRNSSDVEAALGRILSLILSKDLNPNLKAIIAVCLVNQDRPPATGEERGAESDFINFITNTFGRLADPARKFEVTTTNLFEKVLPGDVEKPEFAEKLSNSITRGMPYNMSEALPGEVVAWYQFSRISDRRNRAFEAIQNKINPKHIWLISPWREILPRDDALKQVLFPQGLLLSFGLKEGDVFVDEGCFEGLFTIPAAKIVGEKGKVYGIEVAPNALEKLKAQVDQEKLTNIVLINGFSEKTTLESKSVDVVFFGAVLYEMYNPMKSLMNAYSMLKDTGKLFILEWKGLDLDEKPDTPFGPPMRDRLDKELLIGLVKKAGFKIEAIREENFYLYSITAAKG